MQKGRGLSGELPSFTHAQGLSVLRLDGNAFTGQLPELPSTVQEIRVQNNELHGSIPRGYGFLKQLHTFKAEENKLSGSIPSGSALPVTLPGNTIRHLSTISSRPDKLTPHCCQAQNSAEHFTWDNLYAASGSA